MKAKVKLIDKYSGRSINLISELEENFCGNYEFTFDCLSKGQRKKIEDFFGKYNAYHTDIEIIRYYE